MGIFSRQMEAVVYLFSLTFLGLTLLMGHCLLLSYGVAEVKKKTFRPELRTVTGSHVY